MSKKETILDLYFNKHLKQKEIANQVGTSQQYISKIIKTDERYNEEKSSRKSINAEKRKIAQAEYQKNYVRTKKNNIAYEKLLAIHAQDAMELSYNAYHLSDYDCKKANSSIYEYDSKKNQYVMIKGIVSSLDLPRRVSTKVF